MKLCVVAVGAAAISELNRLYNEWQTSARRERLELATHYVGGDTFSEAEWPNIFASMYASDFIILDTMGVPPAFSTALVEGLQTYRGHIVVVNTTSPAVRALTRLGHFSLGAMIGKSSIETSVEYLAATMEKMRQRIELMEKVGQALPVGPLRDMRNYIWMTKYWMHATRENMQSLLFLIGREYFGIKDFPSAAPPTIIQDSSIMEPTSHRVYASLTEYWRLHPRNEARPTLGLLFRARNYPLDVHGVAARLLARLSESFNIIPIGIDTMDPKRVDRLRALLLPEGKRRVDLLINIDAFRLAQGPVGGDAAAGVAFLRDLDVPVLHPLTLSKRTIDEWLASSKGAEVGEFLISIFLPELDGCSGMIPVGAVGTAASHAPELAPIEERIERLVARASKWTRLARIPNAAKRLAIIFYNYPPGEGSVGACSFLDTFASLAALLARLHIEGYTVTPMSAQDLKRAFVDEGRLNNPAWHKQNRLGEITVDASLYRQLTADMPHLVDKATERWGRFPGNVMSDGARVAIPGIVNGNVFIGVQPARSASDVSGMYHDKQVPPHHQYIAFYRWLEHTFRADAIIHVGTHGTLEFLPGKEKAPSAECFPDALIGNLPHLYLYYSGNPSEAMIAKRRTHAVCIGHMPPPFTQAELYGELQELRTRLDEYAEAEHLNPERCPVILEEIQQRVQALGWEWEGLGAVHAALDDMRAALIPARLHTFGNGYTETEIVEYLVQLLRQPGDGFDSLWARLAAVHGLDWAAIVDQLTAHTTERDKIAQLAREWVERHIIQDQPITEADAAWQTIAQRGKELAQALRENRELDQLMHALNGGYIPPGPSGDLFRNPDILPTGRNLIQFDPRQVPSPSALTNGARIATNTLERYRQVHGRYPQSVAVVLWGLETSKTQGETVGQILAYLGVRMARGSGPWELRPELIPLDELGRPRIDVTVQMCGFFRDMFPTTLALLQQAFELVGFAPEPDDSNYVRAHARQLYDSLRQQGKAETEAREFALARIFGPANSEYGTSVEALVNRSQWEKEEDLVTAYMDSLQYVYTPNHYGTEMPGLLTDNLRQVEVVSQVRSSRDYEITDLDHYYEFFGGLARAVEQAAGKKAMLLISDTHAGHARTEDVHQSIRRGVYTRLLNPQWLDGMLAHNFHGGQQIAKRLENLIGLAATTGAVDATIFDRVGERLVLDVEMRKRLQENNPFALAETIQRLLEAHQRGYWSPDAETLSKIQAAYLDLESYLEGQVL